MEPVVFEISDERENDDANEEDVRHASCDGISFGPARERPEAFKWGADEEGDAELSDTTDGEGEPSRSKQGHTYAGLSLSETIESSRQCN